jgi:F-type H+-transporting ATPase subunit O
MKTPRSLLARIIADKTLNSGYDADEIKSLAAYLLEEKRTGELAPLLRDVQRLWAAAGIVEVIAYSAHELSSDARHEIEAEARRVYPRAERIVLTSKHDPSVIGGVRLEFADYRLDLSVATELRKFKTLAVQGKDYR